MLQCLYPQQHIIVHHFLGLWWMIKIWSLGLRWQRLYLFCKYTIVFKHCFINIIDACPCLIFSRSPLVIKSSRLIGSLFHSSLALWSFSSSKSCLLHSSSLWSVNPLNRKLVLLNAVALNAVLKTLLRNVNNNDAIYFLPRMIDNQSSPHIQKCND